VKLIALSLSIALLLSFPTLSHASYMSRMEYAQYLMNDQDYFRAISAYKQILFFSDNIETQQFCTFQIARAYLKSNRYKSSIRYLSRLLNKYRLDSHYLSRANIYLGLNYYGMKVYPIAEDYLNRATAQDSTGSALFLLALLDLEKGNWERSAEQYEQIALRFEHEKVGCLARDLSAEVLDGRSIPHRNPFLAAALSTVIPGSGQVYCQHYYDALMAFIYVTAFVWTSYATYRYDDKFNDNYVSTAFAVSITGLFHIGNIIGAQRTASYFNHKQRQRFLDPIRKKVFSVDY
jgi:tetratricopeptide (TPR) repeat protein